MRYILLALLLANSVVASAGLPPASTKGSGDSSPVTTFEIDTPNIPMTHAGVKSTLGLIPNGALENMPAHTFKGNDTGSSAAPSDLSAAQLTLELELFSDTEQGVVPPSGGGTSTFLRADGSWAVPPGGGSSARTTNSVSTNFTLPTLTTDYLLNVNSSSGNKVITLSDATLEIGLCVSIKNTGVNTVTINGVSAQTIDGFSSDSLITQNQAHHLCAIGGNWSIY